MGMDVRARERMSYFAAVGGAVAALTGLIEAWDAIDDRDAVDASKVAFLDELVRCRVELEGAR